MDMPSYIFPDVFFHLGQRIVEPRALEAAERRATGRPWLVWREEGLSSPLARQHPCSAECLS